MILLIKGTVYEAIHLKDDRYDREEEHIPRC